MAKRQKRPTRREKIAASKAAALAEREALKNAVASLEDRVTIIEAAQPKAPQPKDPRKREFFGKAKE